MYKRYLLSGFLLLALFISSRSQDAGKINAIKRELANVSPGIARVDALSTLCFHYSVANTDTAIIYGKQALELATKINYAKGIGDAYNNMGWAYFHKGDYKKAEEYLGIAITKFMATGKKELIFKPLSNIGTVYLDETDYAKSLGYFLQALKLEQETGMKTDEGQELYNIGRVYNLQKNYAAARKYFLQSYGIQKSMGNELLMAEVMMSLGNTYQSSGDDDRALQYYSDALPYFKKHNDAYRQGLIHENAGSSFFNKKEWGKAMQHFLLARDFYRQLNSKVDLSYAMKEMGETYTETNDLQKAVDAYNEALRYARESGSKDIEQHVLVNLSNVFLKKEDYKNAYQFNKESGAIKDSLFTLQKANDLARLQTQFETEKKEKENQLLKTKNDLANANLGRNRGWLVAAGIGLFLLAILLLVVYRNRRVKIKNIAMLEKQGREIYRMNNILEIRALRAQMDPHFIFNCMASLQELIWANKNDEADDYLSKFSRLLRMVLENSENNTVSLDKELDMLRRYLDLESIRLKEKFVYQINVEEDLFTEAIDVPTLIIQPFAENALWHGLMNKEDDRLLKIEIRTEDEMLICTIEDNGIGRQKSGENKKDGRSRHVSKGIKIIEERLRIVREQTRSNETGVVVTDLFNDLQEACGTRVMIRIPIKQSA
jgi:tetratricopeptide (TPR) repeat protein